MTKLRKVLAIVLSLVLVLTVIPAVSERAETKAAETFAITSPTANQLVAAGYIDIEWEAATTGTVVNYDVYINGSKVTTTTSTSYEYYTTKVQAFDTYVKANYTNGTSESTEVITFGVSKKGLGLAQDMGANISLRDMGVAWYYNWGEGPSSGEQYVGIEYVPMVWKETNANNFKRRVESAKSKGYKYILTFNEPDLGGQCDMPVNDVYNVWQGIEDMEGIKISSPVTALWPQASTNWFQPFMTKIDENGDYQPDFISIHCYPDDFGGAGMATWFLENVVDWAWEEYGLPIWVTEFSTTGGAITATGGNGTKEFWEAVMPGLDSREYVERYAAFGFNSATTGLWLYSTGELTPGGQVYSQLGNPANFTPAVPEEPDYKVTTERRSELLDDTKTINNVSCEDYVNASGVTATSNSEIGNNGLASLAIDDSAGSRWESKHGNDDVWLTVDLGSVKNIKEVDILWENASAGEYNIEVSADGVNWTVAAESITGSGGRCDKVTFKNQVSARYVKMQGISRSTDYGYSIFDMAIYGTDDVKVDETTSKAPTTTTQPPTSSSTPVDVENETVANNMLNGLKWTTYVGTWAGAQGTITESNGVVNGSFATTGGSYDEAIYGLQAQALDVVVEEGAEYTYSTKIKATKDMTIRFKITDGQAATETQLVFETINLKAGQTYDYSATFVAPSNEVDLVFALGGGPEGPTQNVSVGIASNNLVKIKDAPTTLVEEESNTNTNTNTTVAPTTTTEVSGETNAVTAPKKAKVKKATKKNAAKKVKVSIKKIKGVKGYQVAVYKTKKNAKKNKKALVKKIVTKKKVTITKKKLKNKKKLFVRVRAYNLNGKEKVWGKWSKIKKVKIK